MTTQPRTCAACGRDLRGKWAGQRLGKQVLCLTCNAAGWNLVKGGLPKPPQDEPLGPIFSHVVSIRTDTQREREQVLDLLRKSGITDFQGVPIEDAVFVDSAQETTAP